MAEEVKKEEVGPAPQATDATDPTATPSITAGDLKTIVNVIDAGAQRGAWRGEELPLIGNLRSKIVAVIESVVPAAEETTETAEGEENKASDAA